MAKVLLGHFFMTYPKLELYYYEECPYCQIVLEAIYRLEILVEFKHIRKDRKNYEKLVKDTGRGTTPCLYIDGKPMHESRDIIRWLEKEVKNLELTK